MTNWPPTVNGSSYKVMVGSGILTMFHWAGGPIPMEDGPTRIMAGHGFRIGNGVGLRSIMVAGFSTPIVVGFGFLAGIGHLPGLPGIMEMGGLVGPLFLLALIGEQGLISRHKSGHSGGALRKKSSCLNQIFETTLFCQLGT